MNVLKYDILHEIKTNGHTDKKTLASILDYPVRKIAVELSNLVREGYLTEDFSLTEKTYQELAAGRPKNAIILATTLGIGALTVGKDVPAGLLELNGEVLIERLIEQLHEVGVYEIDVIVGQSEERFEYLADKYGVNLVYNPEYASKATLHALKLMADKIHNTYIVPSNIWAEQNPFSTEELYSWYSVSDAVDDNSIVRFKPPFGLRKVEEGKGGNSIIGISYILEKKGNVLRDNLFQLDRDKSQWNEPWEIALFDQTKKMIVAPRVYDSTQVFPINDYEQLKGLEGEEEKLDPEIISLISEKLNVAPEEIYDIFVLGAGKTNRAFRFTARNKQYIMRIPGEGTEELVNREQEYIVYQLLKGRGITDKVVYMSPENGYKISEFLEGARDCDPHDQDDILACMRKLRDFHSYKLEVDHTFDVFGKIDFYEELRGDQPSKFEDYEETKEKIMELKALIASFPKEWILSHGDSVPGNFLFVDEEVYLLDWEYAGMQDPHIDIAMFALSAMYTREELDTLIDYYFIEGYSREIKYKIYSYMAVGGLLWSNWSEYKELFGVNFGEYSLRQYQYAKEYYEIVKNEFLEEAPV